MIEFLKNASNAVDVLLMLVDVTKQWMDYRFYSAQLSTIIQPCSI